MLFLQQLPLFCLHYSSLCFHFAALLDLLKSHLAQTYYIRTQESKMDPLVRTARQFIRDAVQEHFPQIQTDYAVMIAPASPKLQVPADYTCTCAMSLSKILSQLPSHCQPSALPNPIQVAEKIAQSLNDGEQFKRVFDSVSVTKPGFINFMVNKAYLCERVMELLQGDILIKHEASGRVVVDYSSPNIAKEMHVGHLRSTIIGDCVARLLEYANHDVLRLNHIGDWGTQFGMLLALLFDRFGDDYSRFTNEISNLQAFYKDAKKRFDEDEIFKKRAYETVVKLQSKDKKALEAWKHICDISRREFEVIYKRLGVDESLIERGESFYHEHMVDVVKDLTARNLLVEDEGRMLLWANEVRKPNEIPLTVVKSDGGYTYDTSDLAAVRQRVREEKGTRIIYVADNGQAVHFQTIFAAARRVGYAGDDVKLEHVGFGLVLGEDKKKFKTRSGDTVKLAELLDEGLQRSMSKLLEKKRDQELTQDEMKAAQEAIGYGCIKYADLSRDRNKDYIFSFDQMLDDKGNTAVYLLYSLTRIRSIKRKAEMGSLDSLMEKRKVEFGDAPLRLEHDTEIKLAKYLLRFPDVILQCIDDLLFHLLCNYLYELSGLFTNFYEACYCIERKGDEIVKIHMDRLLLCEATAAIMDKGLSLLGLKTISRM